MGFLGSLGAGMMTGLGALGVFFFKDFSHKLEDGMLSFAAGIMLAASFFSLILPSIEYGEDIFQSRNLAVMVSVGGIMSGAVMLLLLHRFLPHEHFISGHEGPMTDRVSQIWLFIIAITLHNFPEGMAVGVGFAGGNVNNGISIATGIGIQNVPEGLAVAVSLRTIGYRRLKAFAIGLLTGLAEPVGGLLGSVSVSFAGPFMPWALAFAAGAMIFVISDEIIPETHSRGSESLATLSLIVGFILMMYLDATLG